MPSSTAPALSELLTPALLVDRSVLVRNLDRMAARAHRLGVALRPHFKTHKCVEIARLQIERGAVGITVSTLPEAEACAAAGLHDLTWAVPVALGSIQRAVALARRVTLRFLVDDEVTRAALEGAAAAASLRLHVWLKIDCGYHRAGVEPESLTARALAHGLARSPHLIFDGLLTHAGHSYAARDDDERRRIAVAERDAVVGLARRLRDEGLVVPGVSVGSTPTLTIVEDLEGVTEARPGNYAFFDLTQVALGCCVQDDIAVSVLTTVISHPEGVERVVIDAGALALSKDAGPCSADALMSLGTVCAALAAAEPEPGLRLASLSQEHGVIRPVHVGGLDGRLPVGTRLRVLPNHSCLTTACHDEVHVVDDGRVTDCWQIHRRR